MRYTPYFQDMTDRGATSPPKIPCILYVIILHQVIIDHTKDEQKQKNILNQLWVTVEIQLKYSTIQIEQIENQILTCMFSAVKNKACAVAKQLHSSLLTL